MSIEVLLLDVTLLLLLRDVTMICMLLLLCLLLLRAMMLRLWSSLTLSFDDKTLETKMFSFE